MVDASPREICYGPSSTLIDTSTIVTNKPLHMLPRDKEHILECICRSSQIGIVLLRHLNKPNRLLVQGAFVKIEIKPNVLIHNNGVLDGGHASPLSAAFSLCAA